MQTVYKTLLQIHAYPVPVPPSDPSPTGPSNSPPPPNRPHRPSSKLRLRPLRRRQQQIPNLARALRQKETHPLASQPLTNDIELDTTPPISLANPTPPPSPHETPSNSPILVDHIRNSPSVINNLTPAVPVEELATQLTRADIPSRTVRVCRIREDPGDLFSLLQTLLEPE